METATTVTDSIMVAFALTAILKNFTWEKNAQWTPLTVANLKVPLYLECHYIQMLYRGRSITDEVMDSGG